VCRRLVRSGLLDSCLEFGREMKSKSVLLTCWTKGLVGGMNANDAEGDCEMARARETGGGS
jgi:hypothetical protein